MTLLTADQVQYWCFNVCNVIQAWILWNCNGADIVTIYHHNGLIFNAIGNIYIIWIVLYAIHRNFKQKVNTSSGGSYMLSENEIIYYVLNKAITIIVMIIRYCKYTLNDNQFHQIINIKHNSNLILTVIDQIEIIVYQIKILAILCVVIGETWSLMKSRVVIDTQMKPNLYLGDANSLLFYLTTNRIHNLHSIICIFNSIDIIIVRIEHIYLILIMMDVINMISIHKLGTKRNNGCETTTIQFVSNGNKNIAIIVVHYEEFNVNIYRMDKFYSITDKTNNVDASIIVINTINIIIHQIGYISYFTTADSNDACNSPGTAVYFIAIDYHKFKLALVVSKMNTTNTLEIFEIFLFIIVIIMTARMSMEIIAIVLKWLLLRLFCSIHNGMIHILDILTKTTMLSLCFDALTSMVEDIISKLDKQNKFNCDCVYNRNIIIIKINMPTIRGPVLVKFILVDIHFAMQVIDKSSLTITVSIELFAIVVTIYQLILDLMDESLLTIEASTMEVELIGKKPVMVNCIVLIVIVFCLAMMELQ